MEFSRRENNLSSVLVRSTQICGKAASIFSHPDREPPKMQAFSGNPSPLRNAFSMRCEVELLRFAQKRLRELRGLCCCRTSLAGSGAFAVGLHPKPPRVPLPGDRSEHSGSGICAASPPHHFVTPHPPAGKAVIGRFAVPRDLFFRLTKPHTEYR